MSDSESSESHKVAKVTKTKKQVSFSDHITEIRDSRSTHEVSHKIDHKKAHKNSALDVLRGRIGLLDLFESQV